MFTSAFLIVIFCFVIGILILSFFTVPQQRIAVVERFGKFNHIATAGLNIKIPFIDTIRSVVTTQIEQLDVMTNTKTLDNVTVEVVTSVQIKVDENNVYNAVYQLSSPANQIKSYVFDIVRAKIPSMTLDKVYESKDEIATDIETSLSKQMSEFGYIVIRSLVTDVKPDQRVLDAMNQINEQERLRQAAHSRAEADKIILVKKAEAESEAMRLSGMGIANQRREIIAGLKQSIVELQDVLGSGVNPAEVMQMVMTTQYFDALKEIGANSKTNTLLLPHTSQGIHSLTEQLISADLVNKGK
ncbi:MAG: SPFH domain-containing protein [Burkholderiales bacterium]|nr:SPFH domain-containing protein [Burkholderiales bacterium]